MVDQIPNQLNQREIFNNYVDNFINNETDEEKVKKYDDKKNHSYFVLEEALLVNEIFTKYNNNYKNLLVLESLFHDIGRFRQMKETGTFVDSELKDIYKNIADHGDLGKVVMKEQLLKKLLPNVRIYDETISKVIADHSKMNSDSLSNDMRKYLEIFHNYDLQDIFLSNTALKAKTVLESTNTAIIQDVDRLDIFRKIVKGIWLPMAGDVSIDPLIWDLYKNGKLPSMQEIKDQGLWNKNVGHLVRLSFIDQMNLVPVLIKIKEEGLIEKVYNATGNEMVEDAYKIAERKLEKKINNSNDGILVSRSR